MEERNAREGKRPLGRECGACARGKEHAVTVRSSIPEEAGTRQAREWSAMGPGQARSPWCVDQCTVDAVNKLICQTLLRMRRHQLQRCIGSRIYIPFSLASGFVEKILKILKRAHMQARMIFDMNIVSPEKVLAQG